METDYSKFLYTVQLISYFAHQKLPVNIAWLAMPLIMLYAEGKHECRDNINAPLFPYSRIP